MMKKKSLILLFTLILASFSANSEVLDTGPWRFELKTIHGVVPFIIEFKKKNNKYSGILKNGKETIELSDIQVTADKVIVPLQTYEVSLEMNLPKTGLMMGNLIRHNKNPKMTLPVHAISKISERFPSEKSPSKIDLNGRWKITLEDEEGVESPGVIIFEQKENKLYGSILTTTGDYRFMEGFVSGQSFEAASFDGVYNYLVRGEIKDGKLSAKVLSNNLTIITGQKDPNADLPNAYKHTQVNALKFAFPDLSGKFISLDNPKFKGKPIIIQIFGSWCPNCLDEINFLSPWYNNNKKRGIEIIALAFERSLGHKEAKIQVLKTQKKLKIPYTILLAGSTAQEKPMEKIPGIKNFISFPTTIFLDKQHKVVKVHAGFNGPSTGEFYQKWKKEFNQTVNELLK